MTILIMFALMMIILGMLGYWIIIKFEKERQLKTEEMQLLSLKNSLLLEYSSLVYLYNDKCLDDMILCDKTGRNYTLSSLLNGEYKLLIKFSQYHCKSCIEQILNELGIIPIDKILIIGAFDNKRMYQTFLKGIKYDFPIYFLDIQNDKMEILVDENLPYFAFINDDMCIRNLFIPIKEIPIHTQKYLKIVLNKLCNKTV